MNASLIELKALNALVLNVLLARSQAIFMRDERQTLPLTMISDLKFSFAAAASFLRFAVIMRKPFS